jgi:hypothetical protein
LTAKDTKTMLLKRQKNSPATLVNTKNPPSLRDKPFTTTATFDPPGKSKFFFQQSKSQNSIPKNTKEKDHYPKFPVIKRKNKSIIPHPN